MVGQKYFKGGKQAFEKKQFKNPRGARLLPGGLFPPPPLTTGCEPAGWEQESVHFGE